MEVNLLAEKRKGKMTVEEAGRLGGEKTAETHGPEFYSEIGRKGGQKVARERGPEFYREIGRKGGESRGSKIIGTKVARGRRRRAEVGRTKRE